MPKIGAATVDEHVRLQTARVLDAASALFRKQGFNRTDMSAIAAAVGLARNSLYRYYPNKEQILIACVERDMAPFLKRIGKLEQEHTDPRTRIDAWIDMSIDIATSPAHATLELITEIKEASPELRAEIMALHKATSSVLESAVKSILGRRSRDPALLTAMIAGMVQSGAVQALRRGNAVAVKRELRSAVAHLLRP